MAPSSAPEPVTDARSSADGLACPRCGYDQRGGYAAASGADPSRHPLTARCPECGVEFWWGDLLRSEKLVVPGFVEHASGLSDWWRASIRTWLWCWWPPLFWRRVRLEHRPRNGLAVLWFLGLMVPLHALGTASIGWEWMMNRALWQLPPSVKQFATGCIWGAFHPFGALNVILGNPWYSKPRYVLWESHLRGFPWWGFPLVGAVTMFVLMLLVVRSTRHVLRISSGHVIRAFVYWASALIALWIGWVLPQLATSLAAIFLGDASGASVSGTIEAINGLWPFVFLLVGPWSLAWFWCAITIGWRVERPMRVVSLLLVPTALVAIVIVLVQFTAWNVPLPL